MMQLIDGTPITGWSIRPLGPGDRSALVAGFQRLSSETRRRRYLGMRTGLTDPELDAITGLRPGVAPGLAAFDLAGGLIAVARAAPEPGDPETVHLGVVVGDCWQGHGVGSALLAALAARAVAAGARHARATTLADNGAVHHLLARAGAHDWRTLGGGVVEATVDLPPAVSEAQAA
jgi:acetyltransferase